MIILRNHVFHWYIFFENYIIIKSKHSRQFRLFISLHLFDSLCYFVFYYLHISYCLDKIVDVPCVFWVRSVLVGLLLWRLQPEVALVVPENLTASLRSQGSVRAVCPTPPLQRYLSQCTILREKKGAKIIQSITAKKRFSLPGAVHRSSRGLSVSPLNQWLKTPRCVHVSCTCNHNLPYGFKGNRKSWETWQRTVPAPNGKITEDFHQYHLESAFIFKDIQLPNAAFCSARSSFPMWGEIQINVTERKRTEKGPFFF